MFLKLWPSYRRTTFYPIARTCTQEKHGGKRCKPANTRLGILLSKQSSRRCTTYPRKRSSWQYVYRCCGNSAKTLSRIMFLFHLSFRLFYRYTRTNEGGIQQRTADWRTRLRFLREYNANYTYEHLTYTPGRADPRSGH